MHVTKQLLYATQTPSGFYLILLNKDHQSRLINCFLSVFMHWREMKKKTTELTLKVQIVRFFVWFVIM